MTNLWNFYPKGLETGDKKLPIGKNFGRIPINLITVYHKLPYLIISDKTRNENPLLFIDIETPDKSHKTYTSKKLEKEIHFGITGNFRLISKKSDKFKPHIDIYIPISELNYLIDTLLKIRGYENGQKILRS